MIFGTVGPLRNGFLEKLTAWIHESKRMCGSCFLSCGHLSASGRLMDHLWYLFPRGVDALTFHPRHPTWSSGYAIACPLLLHPDQEGKPIISPLHLWRFLCGVSKHADQKALCLHKTCRLCVKPTGGTFLCWWGFRRVLISSQLDKSFFQGQEQTWKTSVGFILFDEMLPEIPCVCI